MPMVDHIEVGEVDITIGELSHVFNATEVIRVVDPGAFLIEDGGLQFAWREVPGNRGRVAMLMISSSFQESAGSLSVIDGSAEIFVAVWISETRVFAVVAVDTTIACIALALDLIDGSDAGRLWSAMAIAHG